MGGGGGCAVEAELFRKIKMKKRTSYKSEEKIYNDIYASSFFFIRYLSGPDGL